ncbi:hydrogenase nickel incorporation protein HypB [Enterobacter hormaechei]|nr:hydrogenase nickel incorporation protein HypB [Salmonella enterica subsp. enterica serovar Senftenberg]EFC6552368.1 hydrogenase nickel incorporation protein HypB [Escherichia coli]CCF86832.1 Hydrogenase nickel incorporation protein [Salmonella enterica subsp. enterica serovar Senftenberg str. SS209]VAK41482.1 hydrogenase nickel incorporation protein HypB [Enterobacter hormaechei]EBF7042221.1 hydrogenase nickel incorporation protein HypB [Salmonella enterica subsp. enterica serovar Senftenber
MCDNCGCNIPHRSHISPGSGVIHAIMPTKSEASHTVQVLKNLMQDNDQRALHNRQHFDAHGTRVFNLMSSPGSGKTSLLEITIEQLLARGLRVAVIEGDLETENDAVRLRRKGVPVVQITTGMACHLDARMIHNAWHTLSRDPVDILFIENVGNLVCPASFDLGQHHNVVLLSVPEGDDKPEKYPVMFRLAEAVLLTKVDLLPYFTEFSTDRVRKEIDVLAPGAEVLMLSTKIQQDRTRWVEWLLDKMQQRAG